MTFHDDPDLERRLRRIADAPQPPVPDSVYQYAGRVTGKRRGFQMRFSIGSLAGLSRSRLIPAFGVIGAIVIAAVLADLVLTARTNVAASPSPSATAAATAAVTATALPGRTTPASPNPTPVDGPTQTPFPGPTMVGTGFTTPGALSGWTGFAWSPITGSLAPAAGINNVQEWSGGYFATANSSQGPITNQGPLGLWTSPDGQTWTPATSVGWAVSVATAPGGLVAITSEKQPEVWTSADGRVWHDAGKSELPGTLISIAGTSAGIVATTDVTPIPQSTPSKDFSSGGPSYQIEFSTDGLHWVTEPAGTGTILQPDFGAVPHVQAANGRFFLMGITSGPIGARIVSNLIFAATTGGDFTYWSDDGRTWTPSRGSYGGFAANIEFGRDGMLMNTFFNATPGGSGLAWSGDGGKTWTDDPNFGPLGTAPCSGECSTSADGQIVANGTYFLAVKSDGKHAWLSYDGHTWTPVQWGGGRLQGGMFLMPRGVVAAQYGAAK